VIVTSIWKAKKWIQMKLKNSWSSWKVSLWLVRNPGRFLRTDWHKLFQLIWNNTIKYAWCTCTETKMLFKLVLYHYITFGCNKSIHRLTWDYLISFHWFIYWGVTVLIQTISSQFWRSALVSSARWRLYSAQPSCFIPRHFNWRVRISKSKWFVFFLTLNFLLW
jgi:hypothetical protein